ncbi:hypothetical protein C7S18_20960 [Ahniella affigens]|uniref:Glycine-rich domain-containing protein-like n=1 Tax=Ahniella affigens TaxID=2021234 RepID=A0A2P1PXD2_9GAMM|nr:hypothetical protein [Ahniella affigens]AVP99490.1 hypothetical protein C7S18_20960 [Ahniella affigens]
MTPILILLIVSVPLLWWGHRRRQAQQRELFIHEYEFPKPVLTKFRQQHPHLRDAEVARVEHGLRQFFEIHRRTHPLTIGMPSKVVDDLWHQFILDTRAYREFCATAFGHFFHHVPAGSVPNGERVNQELRRTWREACRLDGLTAASATALPVLFLIDQQLGIGGGNRYQPMSAWMTAADPTGSSFSSTPTSSCGGAVCSGGRDSGSTDSSGSSNTDCSTSDSSDSSCQDSGGGDSGGGDSGSSCGGGCGGGGGD